MIFCSTIKISFALAVLQSLDKFGLLRYCDLKGQIKHTCKITI